MTPRQYKEYTEAEAQRRAEEWHVSLNEQDALTLEQARDSMSYFKLQQDDVPLIIKLVENPNYKTSKLFGGAVDLFTHDCIHILLGRGLRPKDEAFVIGYTMGSAKNMKRWKRNLFMFVSKHFYPEGYKFGEEERFVFNMGAMLGSKCDIDLSCVGFEPYKKNDLFSLRNSLRIDTTALRSCYELEKQIFPQSSESQRLL